MQTLDGNLQTKVLKEASEENSKLKDQIMALQLVAQKAGVNLASMPLVRTFFVRGVG